MVQKLAIRPAEFGFDGGPKRCTHLSGRLAYIFARSGHGLAIQVSQVVEHIAIEGFRQRAESFAALVRAGLVSPPETYDQSFIFVAALEKGLSDAAVIEKLKASGCTEAVVFEVPCSIALIQFSRLGHLERDVADQVL